MLSLSALVLAAAIAATPATQQPTVPGPPKADETVPQLGGFSLLNLKSQVKAGLTEMGKEPRSTGANGLAAEGPLDELFAPGASWFVFEFSRTYDAALSIAALWPAAGSKSALPPELIQSRAALTSRYGAPKRTGPNDFLWKAGGGNYAITLGRKQNPAGGEDPGWFWMLVLERR